MVVFVSIGSCPPNPLIEWIKDGVVFQTGDPFVGLTEPGQYELHVVTDYTLHRHWHLSIPGWVPPVIVVPTPELPGAILTYDQSSNSLIGQITSASNNAGVLSVTAVDGRAVMDTRVELSAGTHELIVPVGRIPVGLMIVALRGDGFSYQWKLLFD